MNIYWNAPCFLADLPHHLNPISRTQCEEVGLGALLCFPGQCPQSGCFSSWRHHAASAPKPHESSRLWRVHLPSSFCSSVLDILSSCPLGAVWNYILRMLLVKKQSEEYKNTTKQSLFSFSCRKAGTLLNRRASLDKLANRKYSQWDSLMLF